MKTKYRNGSTVLMSFLVQRMVLFCCLNKGRIRYMGRRQRAASKSKKKFKFLMLLSVLVIFTVSSYMAFKYFVYDDFYTHRPEIEIGSNLDEIKEEHEKNIYKSEKKPGERPYTVLLVGLDTKNMDTGRSDTLMVALVDPGNKKTSLLSIPRDTFVQIAGRNKDKINHAHNYGINSTIMTVEDFLDIKIDYYAQINFDGFQTLVDTLGGVTIDVEKNMTFRDRIRNSQFSLTKGPQHLNGYQALNYARFRGDGEGDFGRNRRQQQVVKALIDQSTSFRSIPKFSHILKVTGDYAETDMDFNVLAKTIAKMSSMSGDDMYSIPMKAYPISINGGSYVEVDPESLEKVKIFLKEVLEGKDPDKIVD